MSGAQATRASGRRLFSEGLSGTHVDEFRDQVRGSISQAVVPAVEEAESSRTFPRAVIEELGASGLYEQRWAAGGDLGKALVIGEELGFGAVGGVGIGISVHLEAVLSILQAQARTDALHERLAAALGGSQIGCLALSEAQGGSDLTNLDTTICRDGGGWRVIGTKAYVSLGAAADFALVLCRDANSQSSHALPALTLVCVPRSDYTILERLVTLGAHSLETVRIAVDTKIPDEFVVGKPGRGLMIAARGLTHERFAAAAQLIGGLKLAVALAATHLRRRRQFGSRLVEHQALRLRLAALHTDVSLAAGGLQALAATADLTRPSAERAVAGAKVAVARLAERCVSDCLQMFGGSGYVESRTPLARMWRDARLARLGGGGDEVLWELVARGLHGDEGAYERHIQGTS